MECVDGTWIIHGLDYDDPNCLHTVDEAVDLINKIGFLPLFKNDIPGFSLEEHTAKDSWWSGDALTDPWEWRAVIAGRGEIAYGKFFDKKAGFITKEWFPYFANMRRDGYDFDALWDDGKASMRQKAIMDFFAEDNADLEIFSNDLKEKAGFGKNGYKGFDGIMTSLQMQTYLCVRDFVQKKNKKGELYGWAIAVYCTPEHLYGRDVVTAAYNEKPEESKKRIVNRIMECYPGVTKIKL